MLKVENLTIRFEDREAGQEVVKGISFSVKEGEILGMTALTVMGLLKKHAFLDSGNIYLENLDLLQLNEKQMRTVQGNDISMIFQEPMTSLNPTMKIGRQVEEALKLHTNMSKKERQKKVLKALEDVELENPELLIKKYPYELSGGMRQRVMIAAAIVCRPKLLIADEPTTALDVNTQESILKLMKKLNQKYKMSILFISHNLRVVNEICSRVVVMKNGEIVEEGETEEIFKNPQHEYTKQLIEAIPTRVQNRKIVLK